MSGEAYQRRRFRQRMNLRACREKSLLVSLTIRQTLAGCAFGGKVCAFPIGDAKPNAVRIAEIELAQIAMQMFLAAMLVDALHAALEHYWEWVIKQV